MKLNFYLVGCALVAALGDVCLVLIRGHSGGGTKNPVPVKSVTRIKI